MHNNCTFSESVNSIDTSEKRERALPEFEQACSNFVDGVLEQLDAMLFERGFDLKI